MKEKNNINDRVNKCRQEMSWVSYLITTRFDSSQADPHGVAEVMIGWITVRSSLKVISGITRMVLVVQDLDFNIGL